MTETNNTPTANISPLGGEDSPSVLAYRVGQLEKASREGFKNVTEQLNSMSKNFVTYKDIETAKEQSRLEHEAIYEQIKVLKAEVKVMKRRTWVQNTLSAVLGVILTLLVSYVVNDITHL